MINKDDLPDWFEYPEEFFGIVDLQLTNLDPWYILKGEMLQKKFADISKRYPDDAYIPFAIRSDNDDVACWSKKGGNNQVLIVHDLASTGWEKVKTYDSFWEWFKQAVDEMIEHEQPYR